MTGRFALHRGKNEPIPDSSADLATENTEQYFENTEILGVFKAVFRVLRGLLLKLKYVCPMH
jgi:hypothetical protein